MSIAITTTKALEELRLGTQILVNEGVLDGFGHLSVRNPDEPDHYFMLLDNSVSSLESVNALELDLESKPVAPDGPRPSIERFIHGEIYNTRPDVLAIVHTHSPALIPFAVSETPLKPVYHMSGFLGEGAPVFDIALEHGPTNMLITSQERGQSLARVMGNSALVLMRGHGATVVGSSVKEAVFRAIYATINAQIQVTAMLMGEPQFLSVEEARLADELHKAVLDRAWNYWIKRLDNLG